MGFDITGISSIFDFGSKIFDKIFPDKAKAEEAKLAFLKLQQEGQLKELEMQYNSMKDQALINLEEAKSPSLFVSGWRPFVGWVCASGLVYAFIIRPILGAFGIQSPEIELAIVIELLFALLGVAGLRTYEKVAGVARK